MAIKDTSRKPYIEDNDSNVNIGFDLPIRRDDSRVGFFATTSTTIEAVKNNIRNLLNTETGERFFQPNLGIDLKRYLFEPITNDITLTIQNDILDVLGFWLPFVEVRDIQVLNKIDDVTIKDNEIRVKILFNIKQDPNTLQSVQIVVSDGLGGSDDVVNTEGSIGGAGASVGGGGGY